MRSSKIHITSLIFLVFFLSSMFSTAQVAFEIKTSPDINFTFVSISNYISGITRYNALKLNVNSDRDWDLHVKSTSPTWSVIESYSTKGTVPDIGVLELRVRNASSTTLLSGYFRITNLEQYLIGSENSDIDIDCPNTGTNKAGNYLSSPSCYEFFVDFRIKPGIDPVNYLKPGLYRLEVVFTIVEDL